MQIPAINPYSSQSIAELTNANRPAAPVPSGNNTFGQVLDSLNQAQLESDNLVQQLASGQDVDLHQVMISAEETDINFRVAMAIRDKLVDAYREVMRMNV